MIPSGKDSHYIYLRCTECGNEALRERPKG
jgi:ribosomal protein S27E